MIASLKRIIKAGWIGFSRNRALSIATIFIMVMIICLATSLVLLQGVAGFLITDLQEKIDISVYFKEDSPEQDILRVKEEVSKIPEVKSVEYISKEECLNRFSQKHKQDPLLMDSLQELGLNPFLPALNIRAWQASQYAAVVSFLEKDSFESIIEKIDYYERKPIIERLFKVTSDVNKAGVIFSIVLASVAVLVAFNTIRLAIYSSREEISVMRLVGASNWFIRGPFIAQGVIVGLISIIISLLAFILSCYFLTPKIQTIIPGFNLFSYFSSQLSTIFYVQLATGIGLGIISSVIAIRKYLET